MPSLPSRPAPRQSEPGLHVPCPDCGAPLAFYYDPCTGEEWYCEACAPNCPACGKKMVRGEAGAACLDCHFWEVADAPNPAATNLDGGAA